MDRAIADPLFYIWFMPEYDLLVAGAGIAGLTAAIKAAADGAQVAVLSKALRSGIGSTNLAQGGIATVTEASDSFASHLQDTLEAGAGLCKRDQVRILTESGPATIRQLVDWGVGFTHDPNDSTHYQLALEGGHSHRRILHAADLTGKEIMRALLYQVSQYPNITFYEEWILQELALTKGTKKRCIGGWIYHRKNGKVQLVKAHATILATGGCGRMWAHTTNPPLSAGDGIAIAHRAGALLEDLEFMQFHPTSLYDPNAKQTFLISEAVRGFGGILKNHLGEEFMNGVHPLRSLAPRDIVARAINNEMARTGKPHVWLDVTHHSVKDIKLRFPNIYHHCLEIGIDISKQWIPVVPAAHYMCGGVRVDSYARTSVPGLYASGEVSATGVHGANRLASNSLLESVVFSLRAWTDIKKNLRTKGKLPDPDSKDLATLTKQAMPQIRKWKKALQDTMWTYCGIVRTLAGLQQGLAAVQAWKEQVSKIPLVGNKVPFELYEFKNLLESAELVLRAAMHRHESRGLHYLLDYPERRESCRKHYSIH